jgi:hypothetical protein
MIAVSLRFHLAVTTTADENDLSDHVGSVMDELVTLAACDDRLSDPGVSLDLSNGHVEVEIVVTGDTIGQAVDWGNDAIRTAIHAAGGFTPDWGSTGVATGGVEYDIENLEMQPA